MNQDIEKCLTLVYEIEGLLHVMNSRSLDSLPAAVKTLLAKKSSALARILSDGIDTEVQNEVELFDRQAAEPSAPADEVTDDNEERLAETVEYEQEEDSEPEAGAPDAYLTKLDEAQAEEDEADTEAAETEKSRVDYYGEIARKKSAGTLLMQNFTVNERFKYAIALFGGSLTAFTAIIDEISTFGSLDEIESYLKKKQDIDTTQGAGKEFFDIIARSFK